jgi:ESF2/ABP1 family protein
MSSSSEDEETPEESSCPSEWPDDDERSYDQEDSDQDKDTEKHSPSRGEVISRGKQRRKRTNDQKLSDQEESDQDKETEKHWHDRGAEPKVVSRVGPKQERKRKRKREPEDRTLSDQEETGQKEENRTSQSSLEKHRQDEEVTERYEGERKENRKKLRRDQSSETVAGIVYLSRVPPFMKPHKVKHLLSRYGSVGRVYLKPEGQFNSASSPPPPQHH